MVRSTLDEIGIVHSTDKVSGAHDYCRVYDELFTPLRDEPATLLELGWGGYGDPQQGGASARMWREYFTKASINIVDVAPKTRMIENVQLFCGSQDDRDFLADVHDQTGDFDIVIDDASHDSFMTMKSFSILWPYIKSGGFYIVEDLLVQEAAAHFFSRIGEKHLRLSTKDIDWMKFHPELMIIHKR